MSSSGSPQPPSHQQGTTEERKREVTLLQRISDVITGSLEKGFYRLGRGVGRSPWLTVGLALLLCAVCLVGLLNFESETRGEKLWVPDNAKAVDDKEWVDKIFPTQSGLMSFIIQDSNVLASSVLRKVLKIHQDIVNITITFQNEKVVWEKICFKKGGICSISSILELWSFDAEKIENMTDSEILQEVNDFRNLSFSPYSKSVFNLDRVLADITYNNGIISGAGLIKVTYFIENLQENQGSDSGGVDARAEIWEKEFAKIMEKYGIALYNTRTKFRDISQDAITGDVILLTTGYFIIFVYVCIMLGRFSRLEVKVWIALAGIVSVGLSVGVSIALCSAMGLFYGPAHTTLPFLLLGIGVDDLFVIVQSWSNIPAHIHQANTVEERIGLALKHAGSSITITTVTDLLAFLVGGTTIIPGLRSFCFFAAVGILCDYVLQTTFFVAWLAIDARRTDKRRDGCCCCLTLPEDYTSNDCGKKSYLRQFFENFLGKWLLKTPTKIFILLAVLGLLGANIYGTIQLEQQFQRKWFLPTGTVVRDYLDTDDEKFVESGTPVAFYTSTIDYFGQQKELHQLSNALQTENKYLSKNSVDNWYEHFVKWANKTIPDRVNNATLTVGSTKEEFYKQLVVFLNTTEGNRFSLDVKWSSGKIVGTRIRAFLKIFTRTKDQVDAMNTLRDLIENVGLSPDPIVYSQLILFSESHKVIQEELYRNVLLAMIVVFLVTLIIIASPATSVLVFLCVLFTVVDVAGLMYFWDLTIDTVSTVVLIIAVGLSVDYASHVGHTFLVKSGTREERTIKMFRDIGPAVWNGGFSTFLAILPLATSESHVFTTFFRILFGVVLFGVFHGLIFLPTMLSVIGPSPYLSAKKMESSSKEADEGGNEMNSKVVAPVQSYTNQGIDHGNGIVPTDHPKFVVNNAEHTQKKKVENGQQLNGEPSIVEMRL